MEEWEIVSSGKLPEKCTLVEITRIADGKRVAGFGYMVSDNKWIECTIDGEVVRDDIKAWRIPTPCGRAL